ncbi:MAG TPA: GNAT family N-acetyltransferase [Rhodocyclaceae bacterium]|nr:GNAT family N-acetyltransferase [Rhodocyclaceae bacterium]
MRFLLDTNILIPLEDSKLPLQPSLANFVRLANAHGHSLIYHPASEDDIRQDTNTDRRNQTLERLGQYTRLDARLGCPWNVGVSDRNDAADNEILYALHLNAAHALVTEDQGIHSKAKAKGLVHRVYTIQTAEDQLRRLHDRVPVQLPNIEDVPLYSLSPLLSSSFFDSLREGYPFNTWFERKAQEGRRAWVNWEQDGILGGICIYARQDNEAIAENIVLSGPALKLATFKVGETNRGRKIGELLLKAAFRYAVDNRLENIFIHGDVDLHHFLFEMLEDFGFVRVGFHPGSDGRDAVYLKSHPIDPPPDHLPPFEYLRRYFPHFRHDASTGKFIVPIKPEYHRILFSDYVSPADRQLTLFRLSNTAGNAIKMAYLCHAQTKTINPGDVVLFFRSGDERAITSIGVVESYETLDDAAEIVARVKRRTVYSMADIDFMAEKPTRVMLFRLVRHLTNPLTQVWLEREQVLKGPPQSITKIANDKFETILAHGG